MTAYSDTPLTGKSAGPLPGYATPIFWAAAAAAVIVGILQAANLSFVNDDAFITFRYAENLVRGNGLVFNSGERVEGYTNFLWTILIALGSPFISDPVTLSKILGITFFLSSIFLFIFLSWRQRNEGNVLIFLPLTGIGLALHRDFCVYATSGLETSMFTFFAAATFATLSMARSNRIFMLSGLMAVMTMLTRPDGVIFFVASILFILLTNKKPFAPIIAFILPSIFLFLPYWIWRYSYYGYFFPNTYYAKSIGIPYYSQGIEYFFRYMQVYYVFILIFILLVYALWRAAADIAPRIGNSKFLDLLRGNRFVPTDVLLAVIFCCAYIFFIVRIGGDFMHARFLIPVTPMLFFIGERLIKGSFKKRICYAAAALIIIVTTMLRNDIFENKLNVGYIVDESRFYTEAQHQKAMREGMTLRHYLRDLPVKMAFGPAYLKTAYYSDVPYVLEASTGLTDTFLAHQNLSARGRPGHEKPAPMDYLRARKIHFYIGPRLSLPEGEFPLNAIQFDTVLAQIVTYDEAIMSRLLGYPEIRFTHIPSYIDEYFRKIKEYPYAKIMQDYAYMMEFYFLYNEDSTREVKFLGYLKKDNILK